jgi:membrane protease YdiL (CAAX protease family)
MEQRCLGDHGRAVLEEMVFRGYIFSAALVFTRWLQPTWSLAVSIISVAVVFSLAHNATAGMTALQLGCVVLTGCLYGSIRFRCRSTLPAVIAHAVYNFTLYLSYWCLN